VIDCDQTVIGMNPFSEALRSKIVSLAEDGVMIGTSSWKYPGWCGQIYDERRYLTHNKFSNAKFERKCLSEYAKTFSTVCVDAGYYKFPTQKYLEELCAQVPADFLFSFKVTDFITLKQFPNQPRHGSHAGKPNENFLNADLFRSMFLRPCESIREHVGMLMFEFSQFYERDFARGRDFVEALDNFFGKLPTDWQYGVEIRNKNFLQEEYFSVLSKHNVAHVFNSWTRMPSVAEQLAMEGSMSTDFTAARLLLTPGRTYTGAVESFSPYKEIKEPDQDVRAAAKQLIKTAKTMTANKMNKSDKDSKPLKKRSFVYVNNRLEGNALQTISAILES